MLVERERSEAQGPPNSLKFYFSEIETQHASREDELDRNSNHLCLKKFQTVRTKELGDVGKIQCVLQKKNN